MTTALAPRFVSRWTALALLAGLLAGCGTSGVSDDLSPKALQKTGTAIGILKVAIVGAGCSENNSSSLLMLGQKSDLNDGSYKGAKLLITRVNIASKVDVIQFEATPGEYHVIEYKCTYEVNGTKSMTLKLGEQEDGKFRKSFASFRLDAGEIVNLGYLKMTPKDGEKNVLTLTVEDLPPASLAEFAKDKPNLARNMVKRLMIGPRPARS